MARAEHAVSTIATAAGDRGERAVWPKPLDPEEDIPATNGRIHGMLLRKGRRVFKSTISGLLIRLGNVSSVAGTNDPEGDAPEPEPTPVETKPSRATRKAKATERVPAVANEGTA